VRTLSVAFVFDLHKGRNSQVNRQNAEIQEAALRNLHERIKQVVKSMNGSSEEMEVSSSPPEQMCDGPSNVTITALHIELPGVLVVDLKSPNPLGLGNALSVLARRTMPSGVLSDIGFSFVNGEWLSGGKKLSDGMIRECLTLKGPVPVY
jgi:hypothetical protein